MVDAPITNECGSGTSARTGKRGLLRPIPPACSPNSASWAAPKPQSSPTSPASSDA